MRVHALGLVLLSLFLASCGQSSTGQKAAERGPPGPAGPPGPVGPGGPPGPAGRSVAIRFAEFACQQPACSAGCEEGERLLNAYAVSPGGSITVTDDRAVTYRPTRRGGAPSGKLVLACVAQ